MEKITNPWLIMGINMTIVFAVLISLWVIMKIIYLVDPTRIKKAREEAKKAQDVEATKVVETVAAPVKAQASVAPVAKKNDEEIIAVIAAVVAMGYSSSQIASVRPVKSSKWAFEGRLAGRM